MDSGRTPAAPPPLPFRRRRPAPPIPKSAEQTQEEEPTTLRPQEEEIDGGRSIEMNRGDDEDDPSIVILNPFWAQTAEERHPRLTVRSSPPSPTPSIHPPHLPSLPHPPSSPSAASPPPPPPPRPASRSDRPLPPSSISSELLLLSNQLPPEWSDLLTMSMLSPTSAEVTPDGSSSPKKLTSQSSSGSGTRRPLIKQKKQYESAEDMSSTDVYYDQTSHPPAVTINVSASGSPYTCPSLIASSPPAAGAASPSSWSSLPTAGGVAAGAAPPTTASFDESMTHSRPSTATAGIRLSDSSHHLKPSSCAVVRTRSPSPSGLRFGGGCAGHSDVVHSASAGGGGSHRRAPSGGPAGLTVRAGSGGSAGGAGGSRGSRQQSVESRASSSIPAAASVIAGHSHHHHSAGGGGSNSSKTGPIEDGAQLPSAFEPVPLNLYGKPLQEIDPTVRDKVTIPIFLSLSYSSYHSSCSSEPVRSVPDPILFF